jgi:hypothetical protein
MAAYDETDNPGVDGVAIVVADAELELVVAIEFDDY